MRNRNESRFAFSLRTLRNDTRGSASKRHWARLQVECLDERIAPAVFNVNSLDDFLIPPPGTLTLRAAIEMANATPGGNTINLTVPGDYKITLAGTPGESDNAAGEFAILPSGGNLTIQNTSGGRAVVDGNNLNRVFDINPANGSVAITVTMIGFTIANGVAFDPANPDGPTSTGGGIRDQGGDALTLSNMTIANNRASADGGGICMENVVNNNFALTINESIVSNNHAGDAGGGIDTDGTGHVVINPGTIIEGNTDVNQGAGVYIDTVAVGATFPGASMHMEGTIVRNNQALAVGLTASGGGISNAGNQTMTIITSTIENNFSGGNGGGFSDENNAGTLVLSNSIVRNNVAVGDGGGIQEGGPSMAIANTEFDGNTSSGTGGALFANGTAISIGKTTFFRNTATTGGGAIEIQIAGTGAMGATITNSTITDNNALNNAGANGGGIEAPATFTGSLQLNNDTITSNFATNGGGILWTGTSGSISLINTIVAKNTVVSVGPDANNPAGMFTDQGHNLIGIAGAGSGNTGFGAPGSGTLTGTVATPLDPQLKALANNGGPVIGAPGATLTLRTRAELPNSPAVNAGMDNVIAFDERGVPRPQGPHADIGAFELIQLLVGTGKDIMGLPVVNVYDAVTHNLVATIDAPFGMFPGQVRVALGDVTADSIPDVVIGAGPGGGPRVKVFNALDGVALTGAPYDFMAFDPRFSGGVYVAVGDFDRDGIGDIIVGAGAGGGPEVRVFSGADGHAIDSFYAYSPFFSGGVRVAAADVNGDGVVDLITGAGPGGGPHVQAFDGTSIAQGSPSPTVLDSFYAFNDGNDTAGVYVSGGPLGSDARASIVIGNGEGGSEMIGSMPVDVEVLSGAGVATYFNAFPGITPGVRVAVVSDINGNGLADIVAGPGPGTADTLSVFDGTTFAKLVTINTDNLNPGQGVYVGGF
jgi:predicted outer membrane repeat protein